MKAAARKSRTKDEGGSGLSGAYVFPNGDRYEGEYSKLSDGVLERNGAGKHITTEGISYSGSWVKDKMSGQGRLEVPSGAIYEGEFVNNKFHGRGKYYWPNGSFYSGEFSENKMEGEGEFTDTDGQIWTGTFRYKAAPGLRFKQNM